MVLTVQSTIADPQLQLIDKVADVLRVLVVQVPQVQVVRISRVSPVPGAGPGEDSRDPTVAPYQHDKLLTCPLLSTTGAYGPDSAENCVLSDHRDSTVAVLLKVVDVPVVLVVQAPHWWRQSRSHSCRSSRNSGSSSYGGGGGEGGFSHSVHLDVECPPCRDFFLSPRWPTVVGRRGLSCRSCDS